MKRQRVFWLCALAVAVAVPSRAGEQTAETHAAAQPRSPSSMARVETVGSDGPSEESVPREAEGTSAQAPAEAPAPRLMNAGSNQETVPTSASATTGPDAGPVVMLRCRGADGVFTFDAGSDDFVAWAFSPGPIDLTVPFGLHYKFGVVPPLGEVCRIFREPFPPGVVPP